MSSNDKIILNSTEKLDTWPIYDSSHTFKYSNFSIIEKQKLFKIVSRYYIYCNQVDTKAIPQFVGVNKKIFLSIVNYLFLYCSNPVWIKKFKIRINNILFLKEYFNYLNNVLDEKDDSFLINKIFKEELSKSIKSLTKLQIQKLFLDILKEYDTIYNDKYDLEKIKTIAYRIIEEDLKLDKPSYQKINKLLKDFNKYIASLTEKDFKNIHKIRNLDGYKYPKCYTIELDTDNEDSNKKEIPILSKKRNREVTENIDYSNSLTNRKKSKDINIISNFLNNISKDTYSDIVFLRKLTEEKDKLSKEIIIENESDKTIISKPTIVVDTLESEKCYDNKSEKYNDNKKEFIKTLPSHVFVLLKSKGCINYSGFIKSITLNSDEELTINTDILMNLYDRGFIIE